MYILKLPCIPKWKIITWDIFVFICLKVYHSLHIRPKLDVNNVFGQYILTCMATCTIATFV